MSNRHQRATRYAATAAVKQLAVANEHHHRAEIQRRAMMTPEQRGAADHALEVEETVTSGRKVAGQKAFTVVAVGVIAAWIVGSVLTGWLVAPVLAATVVVTVRVYRTRMRALACQLDVLEGRD